MNTETGDLLSAKLYAALKEENAEEAKFFEPVPNVLEEEAQKELAGRDKTVVDLKKRTPLTTWAHQQNTKKRINTRRSKNHISKASRKKKTGVKDESL